MKPRDLTKSLLPSDIRRALVPAWLAVVPVWLVLGGCASGGAAQPAPAAPTTGAEETAGAAPTEPAPTAGAEAAVEEAPPAPPKPPRVEWDGGLPTREELAAGLEPPGGEWLRDEEGREYFVLRLPKSEPWYWADEESRVIRYRAWEMYTVIDEDEELFRVRYHRPAATKVWRPEPTAEELADMAATYAVGIESEDRLRLETFGRGLPESGQWRNGFDLADMNGDGCLDIVHGPPRKAIFRPLVLLGDCAGNFSTWQDLRVPPISYVYGDVEVEDLDGDGVPDMVLAMHLQGLVALRGDGKGSFELWSEGLDYQVPGGGNEVGFSTSAVAVVDWDGDGRPDILALGEGPRPSSGPGSKLAPSAFGVVLFLNRGDGTWRRVAPADPGEIFGSSITVGDFDGDGRPDFATGSSTFGLRSIVNMNQGDGSWRTTDLEGLRPRAMVRAVEAADLDGDGRDELAVAFLSHQGIWRAGIDLFSLRGDRWERESVIAEEGKVDFTALALGDLDGDGLTDLVALDETGAGRIFRRDPQGGWVEERSEELAPLAKDCRGYHVRLADFDGDGRQEVVAEFAGEPTALFGPDVCTTGGSLRAWELATPHPAAP